MVHEKKMDPGPIGQLKDGATVHGERPEKMKSEWSGVHDKSSSDVIFEMEKDYRIGRRGWNESVIGKVLRRLRSSIQVFVVTDLEPALEGLKRLLQERKQAMNTQQ